jgi:hypothetical protein
MSNSIRTFFLFVLFCLPLTIIAQDFYPTQRKVEKSRIQYHEFDWKYYSSQNFEVFYYGKNEVLARTALKMLDGEVNRISNLLGYSPFEKTKVFLYPSHEELFQSNSGVSLSSVAEIKDENYSKFKIEIAFEGNLIEFKKKLFKEVVKVYVHDMLFGGSIKDALQNSLLLSVSDWYILGIAAYIAEGDTPEMNQFAYQVINNNKIRKLSLARGQEAEWLGQSIWSYIVKMYGQSPISNILNLTRIIRNEQSSISSTLKKPFAKMLQDWAKFNINQYKFIESNTTVPANLTSLTQVNLLNNASIKDFKISRDGKWLAFVSEESAKYNVQVINLTTKKKSLVFQANVKDPLETFYSRGPLVSWGKSNVLSIIYTQEGTSWLQNYQPLVNTKTSFKIESKKNLGDVNILDFELSSNNQRILVRSLRNGQVDVGLYDIRRSRYSSITQDVFDETEAHFIPNSDAVYYVSKNITDSLVSLKNIKGQLTAAYQWNVDEPSKPIPLFYHQGEIKNLRFNSDSTWTFLSTYPTGNSWVTYSKKDSTFKEKLVRAGAWLAYDQSEDLIVLKENDILSQGLKLLPKESLNPISTIDWLPALVENNQENPSLENPTDSTSTTLKRFEQRRLRLERQQSLRAKSLNNKIQGPLKYENSFVINSSEGQFLSDPVRGLGYSFEVKMNDLMENHLIKTGIFVGANLKNVDLWGEYSYLAKKIDWNIRFDRKVLDQENQLFSQKVRHNRLEIKGIYPFNLKSKMSISGIYTLNRSFDQYFLGNAESVGSFGGGKLEYNFDNTEPVFVNIKTGFQLHTSLETQIGLETKTYSFARIKLDARKYVKISNSLFLATRFSASHIFGDNGPQTMLGGMDNWLFIQRETRNKENPLGKNGIAQRDIFMSDIASPLRGFNVNRLSGTNHLLVNVELRVPVKSLLGGEYVRSTFMNTLQFIGFTDVGSAWTGASPFSKSNGFNTNVYGGQPNPFQATVTDFRNPFLMGYGVGARAEFFGYFIKLDYAYGLESGEVKSPMSYLSIGHDF